VRPEPRTRNASAGDVRSEPGWAVLRPPGADFTLWINTFKNEVYRNWIVPLEALGSRRHVDFEFIVNRNGSISVPAPCPKVAEFEKK
jgi:hypothetical protein